MNSDVVAILTGPTASGKTALALELCAKHGVEIINADSLLFYRYFDIGTAKPSALELTQVPHHLVNICEPHDAFTAGDFEREARVRIQEIAARGKRALLVGGSGFYLRTLLYGIWDAPRSEPGLRAELEKSNTERLYDELHAHDPQSATRIGAHDRYRLVRAIEIIRLSGRTPSELEAARPAQADAKFPLWVIDRAPPELDQRIKLRTRQMLEAGLVDETRTLVERFPGVRALGSVGYAETVAYLQGRAPAGRKIPSGIAGLTAEIELGTRQLVKRQRTWFRGEPASVWFKLELDRQKLVSRFEEFYGS